LYKLGSTIPEAKLAARFIFLLFLAIFLSFLPNKTFFLSPTCSCNKLKCLSMSSFLAWSPFWRHDTQHNDTHNNDVQQNDVRHNDTHNNDVQHNDTQYNGFVSDINYTQHNNTSIMLIIFMLIVAFNKLLCWMSLCWMSLFWVSWRPQLFYLKLKVPFEDFDKFRFSGLVLQKIQ